ncbi:hypothetical protein GIS00_24605 [Nakamurella sp. YIM 132087]|uniref:ImmA/IrrE family metallo-endopeptidase n=1 Tax=Nakamurella alba TaxID=2665158 RepID=A0A7K1FSJ1_9ACTN|nr:hypothetical protein [Nakamurella alba]MTD17122.1 hypothetical protein [Nakamurella alba]
MSSYRLGPAPRRAGGEPVMATRGMPPEEEPARRRELAAARVRASHDLIVAGVQDLVTGKDWAQYLRFAARFHSYSFNNSMLIFLQRPDATMVTGYRTFPAAWPVCRGEKGIAILAPVTRRTEPTGETGPGSGVTGAGRRETGRNAGVTGGAEPVTPTAHLAGAGETGAAVRAGRRVVGVRGVSVFDVSQTGPIEPGFELPLVRPRLLDGEQGAELWTAMEVQLGGRGFEVQRGECGGANSFTDFAHHLVKVRDDVSQLHATNTLAHEYGHVLLHDPTPSAPGDTTAAGAGRPPAGVVPRDAAEVEAESVAFMVLHAHDLDAGDYTFPTSPTGPAPTTCSGTPMPWSRKCGQQAPGW